MIPISPRTQSDLSIVEVQEGEVAGSVPGTEDLRNVYPRLCNLVYNRCRNPVQCSFSWSAIDVLCAE